MIFICLIIEKIIACKTAMNITKFDHFPYTIQVLVIEISPHPNTDLCDHEMSTDPYPFM